jgi:DNA-binding XRE family transcriptional regulator
MTEADLADRAGISRRTLQKIERGDLTIAIGFAFEVAALVGIKLFDADTGRLAQDLERIHDKIALLPKRVRKPQSEDVIDDF